MTAADPTTRLFALCSDWHKDEATQVREVRELLAQGANIHARDPQGKTFLHNAILMNRNELFQLALEQGVSITRTDTPFNNTPLHEACAYNRPGMVASLLERGANARALNRMGATPLHKAMEGCDTDINSSMDICRMLFKHGADIDALVPFGGAPLHKVNSSSEEHETMRRFLLREGCNPKLVRNGIRLKRNGDFVTATLTEMRREVRKHFKPTREGYMPTRVLCFDENGLRLEVVDACATEQFGKLIAAPLFSAGDEASLALFAQVYDALPKCWQHVYAAQIVECRRARDALQAELLLRAAAPEAGPHERALRRPRSGPNRGGRS